MIVDGECLGMVYYLIEMGFNDVLVVYVLVGFIDQWECLIFYLLDQVVGEVDLVVGCMVVDWDLEF